MFGASEGNIEQAVLVGFLGGESIAEEFKDRRVRVGREDLLTVKFEQDDDF